MGVAEGMGVSVGGIWMVTWGTGVAETGICRETAVCGAEVGGNGGIVIAVSETQALKLRKFNKTISEQIDFNIKIIKTALYRLIFTISPVVPELISVNRSRIIRILLSFVVSRALSVPLARAFIPPTRRIPSPHAAGQYANQPFTLSDSIKVS